MKRLPAHLVTLTLIAWVAAYLGVGTFGDKYWFVLDAIGKLSLSIAIAIVIKGYYAQTIANSMAVLAASNLVDELFFNPESTGLNEYIFGLCVLIYTGYKIVTLYALPTKRNT
jgi:peptidoglycan/LPS O-acetylase OafA/YrhL